MILLKNIVTEMMSPYGPAKKSDKNRGYIGAEHHGVIYAYDEMVPDVIQIDHSEFGGAVWGNRWRYFLENPKNTVVWNGDTFPPDEEVKVRVVDWLEKKGMKVEKHISPLEYNYITR